MPTTRIAIQRRVCIRVISTKYKINGCTGENPKISMRKDNSSFGKASRGVIRRSSENLNRAYLCTGIISSYASISDSSIDIEVPGKLLVQSLRVPL